MKIFNKIYWSIKDAKDVKNMADEIVEKYGNQLRMGTWKLMLSDKAFMVKMRSRGLAFFQSHFKRSVQDSRWLPTMRILMQNILCMTWKYECSNDENHIFRADCVMLSRNGSASFYDLEKNLVKKEADKDSIDGYYALKGAGYWDVFCSPVINIEDGYVYERAIIDGRNKVNDGTICYQHILEKYSKYIAKSVPVERHTIKEEVAPYRDVFGNLDKVFSKSVENLSLNFYTLHGDFHWDNILFDSTGDMCVIDYELVGKYPFFQDIIWLASRNMNKGSSGFNILDSMLSPTTKIGSLFDGILASQNVPSEKTVKLALYVLTMIEYYNGIGGARYWSERDMDQYICNSVKRKIEMILEHYKALCCKSS